MLDEQLDRDAMRQLIADTKRRQYKVREPQKMANVLSQLLARRGYAQERSLADQADAWSEAAGPDVARQTKAGLQELSFRKRELLAKIAMRLPNQKLRDLKFRVGPVS